MTIALESSAKIRGTVSKTNASGTVPSLVLDGSATGQVITVANGTGANQANLHYITSFNIAASGSLQIDLAGALTDDLGQSAVFTKVKEVLVITDPTNTNNVIYGNDPNPFVGPLSAGTATITITPGNRLNFTNYTAGGWNVTPTTGDIIKLANSGAGSAVTGTVMIVGLS